MKSYDELKAEMVVIQQQMIEANEGRTDALWTLWVTLSGTGNTIVRGPCTTLLTNIQRLFDIVLMNICKKHKKIFTFFSASWVLLAIPSPAYAYLDPGSISLVLQGVIAGIAGLAATYKIWFFKIKIFIFGPKKINQTSDVDKKVPQSIEQE